MILKIEIEGDTKTMPIKLTERHSYSYLNIKILLKPSFRRHLCNGPISYNRIKLNLVSNARNDIIQGGP